jgi:hypothetical protein
VPYTTEGGYVIPNIARPLTPRTYSLTYSVKFGQGTVSQTATAFHARGPGGSGGFFGGGGPGGPGDANSRPGGGQGGGFRSLFSPLPQTPPADPFAVGANPQTCSAENVGKARQLSAELKAYQAQIEAARTAAGYPATMPAPALPDATVTYHGLGTTYALAVTPKGSGTLRVVAGCMSLHIARADDVTQRKLYAASNPIFFVPQLSFMPAVGMYIVARQPQAGQEMFRVYKLPTTPPKDPFELRASTSCTGAVRNLATPSMAELAKHFSANAATPSWTITAHASKGGTWYELEPGDPTVIPALMLCGRIAATTDAELASHGFAGKAVPEINYAAPLGLYLVRPAPRTSPSPSP